MKNQILASVIAVLMVMVAMPIASSQTDVELVVGAAEEISACPTPGGEGDDGFDAARCITAAAYGMPADAIPDEYVNQFAFVQNPVANPGFSLPVPPATDNEDQTAGVANWAVVSTDPDNAGLEVTEEGHAAVSGGYLYQKFNDFQGDTPFRGLSGVSIETFDGPVRLDVQLLVPPEDRVDRDGDSDKAFPDTVTRVCWMITEDQSGVFQPLDAATRYTGTNHCNDRAPVGDQEANLADYELVDVTVSGGDMVVDNVILDGVAFGPQTFIGYLGASEPAQGEAHIEFDSGAGAFGDFSEERPSELNGFDLWFHDGYSMVIVPTGFHPGGDVTLWAAPIEFTPSGAKFVAAEEPQNSQFFYYDQGLDGIGTKTAGTLSTLADSGPLGDQIGAYFGTLGLDRNPTGLTVTFENINEQAVVAATMRIADKSYDATGHNWHVGGFFNADKALNPLAVANDQLDVVPTPLALSAALAAPDSSEYYDGWAMHIEPTAATTAPDAAIDQAVCSIILPNTNNCGRDTGTFVPEVNGAYTFYVYAKQVGGAHVDPAHPDMLPTNDDTIVNFDAIESGEAILELYDASSFAAGAMTPDDFHNNMEPVYSCSFTHSTQIRTCEVSGSHVTVPADEVEGADGNKYVGPVAAWAFIKVQDEGAGSGADGWYNSLKVGSDGQTISDALDYVISPMFLMADQSDRFMSVALDPIGINGQFALGEVQSGLISGLVSTQLPATLTVDAIGPDGNPSALVSPAEPNTFGPADSDAPFEALFNAPTPASIGTYDVTATLTSDDGNFQVEDVGSFEILPDEAMLTIVQSPTSVFTGVTSFDVNVRVQADFFDLDVAPVTVDMYVNDVYRDTLTADAAEDQEELVFTVTNNGEFDVDADDVPIRLEAAGSAYQAITPASTTVDVVSREPQLILTDPSVDVQTDGTSDSTLLTIDYSLTSPDDALLSTRFDADYTLVSYGAVHPQNPETDHETDATDCLTGDYLGDDQLVFTQGATLPTFDITSCASGEGWFRLTVATDAIANQFEGTTAVLDVKVIRDSDTTDLEVIVQDAATHVQDVRVLAGTDLSGNHVPGDSVVVEVDLKDDNGIADIGSVTIDLVDQDDDTVFLTGTCGDLQNADAGCTAFMDGTPETVNAVNHVTVVFTTTLPAEFKDRDYEVRTSIANRADGLATPVFDGDSDDDDHSNDDSVKTLTVVNVDPTVTGTLDTMALTPESQKTVTATLDIADNNFGTYALGPAVTEFSGMTATIKDATGTEVGEDVWSVAFGGAHGTAGAAGPSTTLDLSDVDSDAATDGALNGITATVTVPEGATPGVYTLDVTVSDDATGSSVTLAPALTFTVIALPTIDISAPDVTPPGDLVVDVAVSTTEAELNSDMVDKVLLRVNQETADGLETGTLSDVTFAEFDGWMSVNIDAQIDALPAGTQSVVVPVTVDLPAYLDDEFTYSVDAIVVPSGLSGAMDVPGVLVSDPGEPCTLDMADDFTCQNQAFDEFFVLNVDPTVALSTITFDSDGDDLTDAAWTGPAVDGITNVYLPPEQAGLVDVVFHLNDQNWGAGELTDSTELGSFSTAITPTDSAVAVTDAGFDATAVATIGGTGQDVTVTLAFGDDTPEGSYELMVTVDDDDIGSPVSLHAVTIHIEPWFLMSLDDDVSGLTGAGISFADDGTVDNGADCAGCPGDTVTTDDDPLEVTMAGSIGARLLAITVPDLESKDANGDPVDADGANGADTIDSDELTAVLSATDGTELARADVFNGLVTFTESDIGADELLSIGQTLHVTFEVTIPIGTPAGTYSTSATVEALRAA